MTELKDPVFNVIYQAALARMTHASVTRLSTSDRLFVARMMAEHKRAYVAYLSTGNGPFTDEEFAAHALRCARRVEADQGAAP